MLTITMALTYILVVELFNFSVIREPSLVMHQDSFLMFQHKRNNKGIFIT
jgi:hypothetical protein